MLKKINEYYKGFYTIKDMFTEDKEYRKMIWKKYGICMSLILATVYIFMGICYLVDLVADKIVEKKVEEKKQQSEDSDPVSEFDMIEYRIGLREKECKITTTIGSIIGIIGSVIIFVIADRFWRKDK